MKTYKEIFTEELGTHDPLTPQGIENIYKDAGRAAIRFANQQTQELQAKILQYRQYLYTRELQAYDKHFGITNKRIGEISSTDGEITSGSVH